MRPLDSKIKNAKVIRVLVAAVMCLLGCLGVVLGIAFDVIRNEFTLANALIDVFCLLFLTLLFCFSSGGDTKQRKQQGYFDLLVVTDFLMTFFSLLGDCFLFLPEYVFEIKLFNAFNYSLFAMFFFVLWLYQKENTANKALNKVELILLSVLTASYTVISFLNVFSPILFSIDQNGEFDLSFFDMVTTFFILAYLVLLYLNILFSDCPLKKKLSISSCEVAPAIALVISVIASLKNWDVYLPAVVDVSIMIPLYIIFFNVHIDQKKEMLRYEAEQTELQAAVTVSQIQPHFLYNSLSVIAALCDENPGLAGKATIDFAEYLRENMNYIDSKEPIPFEDEMNHIRKYIALEELRFPEKLNVEYDIACTDFRIPALSVQPLVDNAVKHGVCKSRNGGTVRISSRESENAFTVTVEDNGVGFDPSVKLNDGKKHIGIESARVRIEGMLGGTLTVKSAVGQGTTATIVIPKGSAEQ